MRFVRYQTKNQPPTFGWVQEDLVGALDGSPLSEFRRLPPSLPLESVRLLPPVLPSKIIGVGRNYVEHAKEHGAEVPDVPLIFLKPPTAVIGPEERIVLPQLEKRRVDYEAELGVVIGRRAKAISRERAKECVLGYTCFNDVSERYAQKSDGQWTRCKGYDTFAPIGPWIETEVDPDDLLVESYLNGEVRQSARTSDLIFGVEEIISFISGIMTLVPGDVIATGTPSGIGKMRPGDVIEIKIEKIGTLKNYVVEHEQVV